MLGFAGGFPVAPCTPSGALPIKAMGIARKNIYLAQKTYFIRRGAEGVKGARVFDSFKPP